MLVWRVLPMDRDSLVRACRRGERFEFLFFWGHTAGSDGRLGPFVFSQWWPSPFLVGKDRYATAEHYMMAEKARLFDDEQAKEEILRAPSPAAAKALGRAVRGFDEATWEKRRLEIVVRGSIAKFGSSAALTEYLLATGARVLVEASPRDRVWGIGMGQANPAAGDPAQWRGQNLLGFALMLARSTLAKT
jgi:ribA/ribD-fused uncharacterized protein